MALLPPALADASSFCPTENSQPVLSHTLKAQEHKNAMSQRSCRAKIFVRPAPHLHCATKFCLRMSTCAHVDWLQYCGALRDLAMRGSWCRCACDHAPCH